MASEIQDRRNCRVVENLFGLPILKELSRRRARRETRAPYRMVGARVEACSGCGDLARRAGRSGQPLGVGGVTVAKLSTDGAGDRVGQPQQRLVPRSREREGHRRRDQPVPAARGDGALVTPVEPVLAAFQHSCTAPAEARSCSPTARQRARSCFLAGDGVWYTTVAVTPRSSSVSIRARRSLWRSTYQWNRSAASRGKLRSAARVRAARASSTKVNASTYNPEPVIRIDSSIGASVSGRWRGVVMREWSASRGCGIAYSPARATLSWNSRPSRM